MRSGGLEPYTSITTLHSWSYTVRATSQHFTRPVSLSGKLTSWRGLKAAWTCVKPSFSPVSTFLFPPCSVWTRISGPRSVYPSLLEDLELNYVFYFLRAPTMYIAHNKRVSLISMIANSKQVSALSVLLHIFLQSDDVFMFSKDGACCSAETRRKVFSINILQPSAIHSYTQMHQKFLEFLIASRRIFS